MSPPSRAILDAFGLSGELVDLGPFGSGHINSTFRSRWRTPDGPRDYIHQRINTEVFRDPAGLMDNIARVTDHLRGKVLAEGGDADREVLRFLPTRDGANWLMTPDGQAWRTCPFIGGTTTYDVIDEPEVGFQAGLGFGTFLRRLEDLPGEPLVETIPRFTDTPWRYEQLREAVARDAAGRGSECREEIDFAMAHEPLGGTFARLLADGALPLRVTHNDTKVNNVMIDTATRRSVCVIDLDTVMPGFALYDLGDAVRQGANSAEENEPDLAKVAFRVENFQAIAAGYLEATREILTPAEIDHVAIAPAVLALTMGIRFLADYLNGDVYYHVSHPWENLDRCRVQLKLVREVEEREAELRGIVSELV